MYGSPLRTNMTATGTANVSTQVDVVFEGTAPLFLMPMTRQGTR